MKNIKWVPLLIIVPFAILLMAFLLLDHPVEEEAASIDFEQIQETEQKKETDQGKDSSEDGENATENSAQGEVTHKVWMPGITEETWDNADVLQVLIGAAGSMKDCESGDFIYAEPDEMSEQISTLQYRNIVVLDEEQDEEDWYHIKLLGKYSEGYVKRESALPMKLPIGAKTDLRAEIVKDAVSYMGLPFVRYGTSLEDGIDCSNFIQQIYAKHGVDLPEKPNDIAAAGYEVTDEEAQPGDIVYYYKANNKYGHVGIYLGNGIIINSSGHSGKKYPKGGVHMCTIVYPDREEYRIMNVIDK